MKLKGQPREFKPELKRFISTEATRLRDIPRERLANRLTKECEELFGVSPSHENCMRMISKARNYSDHLDEPWTLGACHDYPHLFPPTSLQYLIKIQQHHRSFVDLLTKEHSQGFSIRQAVWITRLQPLVKEYFKPNTLNDEWMILFNIAEAYSIAEKTSEIMEEDSLNTSDLDEALYSTDMENVILFGCLGIVKKTSAICNSDCDSCKYVPFIEGKLCQSKKMHSQIEQNRKRLKQEIGEEAYNALYKGESK